MSHLRRTGRGARAFAPLALLATTALVLPAPPAAAEVHLRTGTIGRERALDAARLGQLTRASARPGLFVVAASGAIDRELHQRLADAGLHELTYLPERALAVWGAPQALASLAAAPGVELVAELSPDLRVTPDLLALPPSAEMLIEALVVPDVDLEAAVAALHASGLEVLGSARGRHFQRVVARRPAGSAPGVLESAARVDGLFSLSRRPRYGLLNDDSIWVGQAGLQSPGATPIFDAGIHGEGQVVAVLDTGMDIDMCFFRDPAGPPPVNTGFGTSVDPSRRKVIAYDMIWSADDPANPANYDSQGHGTHVAGSVGGDDLATLVVHDGGDGMAPAAKIVVQDAGYNVDNCGDIPALGCPIADLTPYFDQTYRQGARFHTNSWGDQENAMPQNNYTAACLDSDDFMWTHPDFLILFAAGNSGPNNDTVGSPSVAKNVVSVGATAHGSSANSMAGFSSRGWAADGRIKPTVTCPGSAIVSAANDGSILTNNCGTVAFSGTSMATPTCAGLSALARQYYTDGFYPSAKANPADAFTPSAALVKATIVNSARSMTAASAVISRDQGFGRVTLGDTLSLPRGARQLFAVDEAGAFDTGSTGSKSYDIQVMSAAQALKVTLVWTDYPSNTLAATNLVNDLDLVVTGPGGTFLGNVFSGGFSQTGGSADRLNVEEEVWIASPAPGTWTLRVSANAVPQGPQGFALVATADLPDPPGAIPDGWRLGPDNLDSRCSDGDGIPDNGEVFRLTAQVRNPAATAATNVRVALSTASPYLVFASANPVTLASIPAGGSADADFDIRVGAAPCRTPASVHVEVTSSENLVPSGADFDLVLEEDRAPVSLTLDFESGLVDSLGNPWTTTGGMSTTPVRFNGGQRSLWAGVAPGPGICDGSGSRSGANACAKLLSPMLYPRGTSSFRVATWYQFEGFSGGRFWDRANVHVIDGASHTLLVPVAGRRYDGASGDNTNLCHISGEDGWAGDNNGTSWATTTFDLGSWTGRAIQLELSYNTDNAEICEGLYLDDLTLTDIGVPACDGGTCSVACVASALGAQRLLRGVKAGGAAVTWSWLDTGLGATEYHLNTVTAKTDLAGPDPASPHLPARGVGAPQCSLALSQCTDADALSAPGLVFYQAFAACGAGGAAEGN